MKIFNMKMCELKICKLEICELKKLYRFKSLCFEKVHCYFELGEEAMNVTKSSESHALADSLSEVVVVKVDWSVRLLRFHSQSEHGRELYSTCCLS